MISTIKIQSVTVAVWTLQYDCSCIVVSDLIILQCGSGLNIAKSMCAYSYGKRTAVVVNMYMTAQTSVINLTLLIAYSVDRNKSCYSMNVVNILFIYICGRQSGPQLLTMSIYTLMLYILDTPSVTREGLPHNSCKALIYINKYEWSYSTHFKQVHPCVI